MKNILIGGAWPYANGSLHIEHIAGLLAGDVLARYHRGDVHNGKKAKILKNLIFWNLSNKS